jgi:hypothetical protein
MTKPRPACPQCRASFAAWRAKRYCSEACRKRAQNLRLGYVRRSEAMPLPATLNPARKVQQKQASPRTFRRYEPLRWIDVNAVTRKAVQEGSPEAVAWTIKAGAYGWREAEGWYGRIGKTFSFGPTTEARAKAAVEAALRGRPFSPRKGEILRQGTLGRKFRWLTRKSGQ